MIDPAILRETLDNMLSTGSDYGDIYVESTNSTTIQIEDKKVEKLLQGDDSGAGLRLLKNGNTAYAYTNSFDKASFMDMADVIKKAAEEKKDVDINLIKKSPTVNFKIEIPPAGVSLDQKVKLMREAEKAAWGYSNEIKQVTVIYRQVHQKVQIASSDGYIADDDRLQTVFLINVVAASDGVIQTGYESAGGFIGFELFRETSPVELALKAAKKAVMMLKARRAPGGRMPVVISSEAGGTMIHEAVGHGLEADLSGQGLSVYTGKLGQKIAADIINVVDDSTLQGKRGSFRFDDEGTVSSRTQLVQNGVLTNFMYDRLSAMKANASTTGNGRRQSYRFRPIPRMTNTMIVPGTTPPEQILRTTPKGLLVKKMGGGQVNTLTGDFVFEIQEGYLIENGEQGEPVRGATLAGNGPQVLLTIDKVGTDLGFSIGTCGKEAQGVPVSDAQPTIRIPEIVVGGEV